MASLRDKELDSTDDVYSDRKGISLQLVLGWLGRWIYEEPSGL
jgi:hypothetical protein